MIVTQEYYNKYNKSIYTINDAERFFSKIIYHKNGCWLWDAFKDQDGYGKLSMRTIGVKSYGAHRFSYEFFKGQIPASLVVRHIICNNPSCVNPDHLTLGTLKENKQDSINIKSHAHGNIHGNSILSDDKVKEFIIKIYKKEFTSVNQIAAYYKIDRHTISGILNGKGWNHITDTLLIPLSTIKNMITQSKYDNKLNDDKVRDIKLRIKNGESNQSIAKLYSVDRVTIYEIKRGNLWNHIK